MVLIAGCDLLNFLDLVPVPVFGVATRIRRNCSAIEKFDQRSDEYQTYLVERGYNPAEVNKQFLRAKDLPREDLLASKPKDKKIVFPLVVDIRACEKIHEVISVSVHKLANDLANDLVNFFARTYVER